ncbi:ankyrin [Hyaloscypha bicolor E]|uniref:Ankyrin n=1 Tax=Hyaloscypha bicolor E TaxID=1095630 RepID=A0A2J6STB7_9HELO|nr:ankyrin [Hyaloscypha bicolor E]PMD54000.1 ankyrin [Hyaloscypha bicolor E]
MINISIKVVDLAPEPWTSPYNRRDRTVPERPPFHCLSYTWGNPHAKGNGFEDSFKAHSAEYEDLVDIKCDGKILKIQKKLYHFLCEAPTNWVRSIRGRIRADTGKHLLHDEAASGNHTIVHMYAGQGVDVNVQDNMARSPLHYAANNGMLETVYILIKAGAILDLKDNDSYTAEDLAAVNNHEDIAELLRTCRTEDIQELVKDIPEFVIEYSGTYIWIDAICIDQTNHKERETQVRIMNQIYSLAIYTIIWLGEEDQYTDMALSTISKLAGSAKEFSDSNLIPYRTYSPEDYAKFSVPFISQEEWNALTSIFLRQWFRRVG